MHDDVGVVGRSGRVEVELLGGYVAAAVASLDLGGGSEGALVSDPGAIQCLLERGGYEDAQVPPVDQFRAQEEHAVEEQHGVGGCRRDRLGQCGVSDFVVDRLLEPSISARAQRIEQNPVQRVEVEAVVIAAFGRVLAAPIAL